MRRWTSLASFLLVFLLAGAADGLMEALMEAMGPEGFLAVGTAVLALAWALTDFNGYEA